MEKAQGHLGFMIEGKPVVFATGCKLVAEESEDEWVDVKPLTLDAQCEVPVGCGDIATSLLGEQPNCDVVFELPIGKLPRKMKKAWKNVPFNGNTKWQRKVLAYMKTRKKTFHDCTIDFASAEDGTNVTITHNK